MPFPHRLCIALLFAICAATTAAAEKEPIQKRFRFSYSVDNPSRSSLDLSRLRIPIPLLHTPYQSRTGIHTNLAVVDQGEDWVEIDLPPVPPLGRVEFRLDVTMNFREQAPMEATAPANLDGQPYIEKDDPRIRATALRLMAGNDTRKTLRNLYDWVRGALTPLGYTPNPRGASHAFATRRGDCTEYALLYTALARSIGLPARVVGGFVYPHSARVRAADYHNWAEVQIDGIWFPVDAYEGRFLDRATDYLAMKNWESGSQRSASSATGRVSFGLQ